MKANPLGYLEMDVVHDETQKSSGYDDDTVRVQGVNAKQLTGTETFAENMLDSPGYGDINAARSSVQGEVSGTAKDS